MVQIAIAGQDRAFLYCQEKFGELRNKIRFHVNIDGEITLDEATLSTEAERCYARQLKDVRVGEYSCEFPFD